MSRARKSYLYPALSTSSYHHQHKKSMEGKKRNPYRSFHCNKMPKAFFSEASLGHVNRWCLLPKAAWIPPLQKEEFPLWAVPVAPCFSSSKLYRGRKIDISSCQLRDGAHSSCKFQGVASRQSTPAVSIHGLWWCEAYVLVFTCTCLQSLQQC